MHFQGPLRDREHATGVNAGERGIGPGHLGRERHSLLEFAERLLRVLSDERAAVQVKEARVARMVVQQLCILGRQ